MSIRKIGVIAGSPSDAEMGAVYFKGRGLEVECGSVAEDAAGAVEFSAKDEGYKEEVMNGVIGSLKGEGCEALCIYCNALGAAVDTKKLSEENGIKIVTPFDAYKVLGQGRRVIANLSAATGALAKFEECVKEVNPEADIRGIYMLSMTKPIEEGKDPAEIMAEFGIADYIAHCENSGCECIILSCTHFPYLMDEMKKLTELPVIDPADTMYELVMAE